MIDLKKKFEKIFSEADIKINGKRPWDIKVNNPKFYRRVALSGIIGLGDSYVDGDWDCDDLPGFIHRALKGNIHLKMKWNWVNLREVIKAKVFNLQKKSRADIVGKVHYDLSTELYESFLDPYNQYTCGYWKNAKNLNDAQEDKLDLICKKLGIKKGDKVLEIGCGWGGFAKYAAEHYGCHVTGITISKEQANYAKKFCKGLPVEIILEDYRELKGRFDKVLICGMIEHVGYKNYRTIFKKVHECLKDDGLFLLHTMGQRDSYPDFNHPDYHWVLKHIFPNGMIPSIKQIGGAAEGLFMMQDWHTFGADYDKTIMAWWNNFDKNWPKLRAKYGDRFYRMWRFYLMTFVGMWRAGNQYNLWQIVLSKEGVKGGYKSFR